MPIPLGDPSVRWLTGYRCRRLGIFIGFASFFMMEKTLRVLGGEEGGEGHSHSHSYSHSENKATASGVDTGSENGSAARSRKGNGKKSEVKEEESAKSAAGPSKMSAYLNLFGDFVHNMYARVFLDF